MASLLRLVPCLILMSNPDSRELPAQADQPTVLFQTFQIFAVVQQPTSTGAERTPAGKALWRLHLQGVDSRRSAQLSSAQLSSAQASQVLEAVGL
jgi:hypothetical protein